MYYLCFVLQAALSHQLSHIAQYGTIVQRLQEFVETTTNPSSPQNPPTSSESSDTAPPGVSQTYQAFAAALSGYLQDMQKELTKLEKQISKQGGWLSGYLSTTGWVA